MWSLRGLTLTQAIGGGIRWGRLNQWGIFAYGWWAVLISWVALRTGSPSKPVHYPGLVFGAAGILVIAIPRWDSSGR